MGRMAGAVAWLAVAGSAANVWAMEAHLRVLYQDSFEREGALAKWEFTDPAQWKIGEGEEKGKALSLFARESQYKPTLGSPASIALLRNVLVADFVFSVRVKSTAKEHAHRNLCVVFGYQSPTQFYYVDLASKAGDAAHHVMLVNDKDPTPVTKDRSEGITWGDKWHQVRVVRRGSGSIDVYFDDMEKPVLMAEDQTFLAGRVGIGSFGETGDFDDVHLAGLRVEAPRHFPDPQPPRKPGVPKPPVRPPRK